MRRLIVLFAALLMACANPAAQVPIHGLVAAFHFCPTGECGDVKVGASTTRLPYVGSSGMYDRWCVEVLFVRNGEKGQAAVEIYRLKETDGPFSWGAADPVFNSDCSFYK